MIDLRILDHRMCQARMSRYARLCPEIQPDHLGINLWVHPALEVAPAAVDRLQVSCLIIGLRSIRGFREPTQIIAAKT